MPINAALYPSQTRSFGKSFSAGKKSLPLLGLLPALACGENREAKLATDNPFPG
jgi:hypothetical protein